MTRTEFIKAISESSNIPYYEVERVIEDGEEILMERLQNLEEVRPFYGITLSPTYIENREYKNPRTLDPILISRIRVKTAFSKTFKDKLNERIQV